MAERQRKPLGDRGKENLPQAKTRHDHVGQRIPLEFKAEDGLVEGALKVKRSVSELRKDLAKAREKFGVNAPSVDLAVPLTSTPNDTFEVRLQHLTQKHQSSKAKYTAKVDELNAINATLHKACAAAKSEYEVLQAENARMMNELQQAKASLETATERESKERNDEHTALRREIQILSQENKRLVQREDKVEEMEEEREWLETVVEVAARQCGRSQVMMVDRQEYERVRRELETLKLERTFGTSEEDVLRHRLLMASEECRMLHAKLEQSEQHRRDAEETIADLLEQRQRDRGLVIAGLVSIEETPILDSTDDDSDMRLLEERHADLVLLASQGELRQTLEAHRRLIVKNEILGEKCASTETILNSLRTAHSQLQERCTGLEGVRDVSEQTVINLQQEVTRWQHAESTISTELTQLKVDHRRLEVAARHDREALKRANDSVMRSKSAEDALAEQVVQLSEALDRAAPFEELYHHLLNENGLLVARETLAAEEAERLGMRNAELIGHANGDQKISYVESVRREMAITKHASKSELASTRHQLNVANDKLNALSEEVEAYKSVGGGLGLNASTRTRVVRRVPEGTWLGKSVRGTGRSVSGPVHR